jgi:hypothetical protein
MSMSLKMIKIRFTLSVLATVILLAVIALRVFAQGGDPGVRFDEAYNLETMQPVPE